MYCHECGYFWENCICDFFKIFIINGCGGSGKDTFIELFEKQNFGRTYNISTITKIKHIAKQLGWNGLKEEKDRKFLSDLKIAWIEYCNGPFNEIINNIRDIKKSTKVKNKNIFIFIHCREPNEIKAFVKKLNCKTILIKRPGFKIKSNPADGNIEDYKYDHIFINDGTLEDLEKKIYDFGINYV